MDTAQKLDSLVDTYAIDTVSEQYKRLEFIEKLSMHRSLKSASVLELGCASGRLTELLARTCANVTAVDGSSRFLDIAKKQVGSLPVTFVESLFEEYQPRERADVVVMHHILEHVDDAVLILRRIREFLQADGLLAISVPNAMALSRQLAVSMGLLGSVYDLTANDHHHGHQRVYDWGTLEADALAAGYRIKARHGLALKLFADFQNERIIETGVLGEAQFHGLWKLADRHPDISGALMMVLQPAPTSRPSL